MKHLRKIIMILILFFISVSSYSTDVEAMTTMELKTQVISSTKVKLSWKKQKGVDGYKIYRATDEDDDSEYVLVADLGKKKTSFIDKKAKAGMWYEYTIKAYYMKNGKEKRKYWGSEQIATLPSSAGFSEHNVYENMTITNNKISIPIGNQGIKVDTLGKCQIKPDGIEIFKKNGKKWVSYKKIKFNKNKANYKFVDKKVKNGKKYQYKFRTYKKINGKMVYSKKTKPLTISVTDNKPSCDAKIIKPYDVTNQEMIIAITNKEKTTAFKNFKSWLYVYNINNEYYEVGYTNDSKIKNISYSYDQVNWKTDIENCKIEPGSTVYFSLKIDGKPLDKNCEYKDYFSVYFKYGFYDIHLSFIPTTGEIKITNEESY